MVELLDRILYSQVVNIDRLPVASFVNSTHLCLDDSHVRIVGDWLKQELTLRDDLVGVCDRSGQLQLVFKKPAYDRWVKGLAKSVEPEDVALSHALYIRSQILAALRPKAA